MSGVVQEESQVDHYLGILRLRIRELEQRVATLESLIKLKNVAIKKSSIANRFVEDCCVVEPGANVAKDQLYLAYRVWFRESNRGLPAELNVFCRDLIKGYPEITSRRANRDFRKVGIFAGIGLLPLVNVDMEDVHEEEGVVEGEKNEIPW